MPLARRLARRYKKSEAEIRAALAATGDAESECMDGIPAELTARLDAHFARASRPPAAVAADESLRKVETTGGDDTPAEMRQEVRELKPEDGKTAVRPPSSESAPLRQVETVSE